MAWIFRRPCLRRLANERQQPVTLTVRSNFFKAICGRCRWTGNFRSSSFPPALCTWRSRRKSSWNRCVAPLRTWHRVERWLVHGARHRGHHRGLAPRRRPPPAAPPHRRVRLPERRSVRAQQRVARVLGALRAERELDLAPPLGTCRHGVVGGGVDPSRGGGGRPPLRLRPVRHGAGRTRHAHHTRPALEITANRDSTVRPDNASKKRSPENRQSKRRTFPPANRRKAATSPPGSEKSPPTKP